MKKIIAIVLCLCMTMACLAGCGGTTNQPSTTQAATTQAPATSNEETNAAPTQETEKPVHDAVTIGVIVGQYNDAELTMKNYFENELGPALNVKFIFSEASSTLENMIAFIENAYSSGAEGIIDYGSSNASDTLPLAEKCSELDMYYVTYYPSDACKGVDSFAGIVDTNNNVLTETYDEIITKAISDGENHSMVLCTVAARYGNVQQYNSSKGAMQAFVKAYDLPLTEDEIHGYIMSDAITEVDTGRDDVKITIMPLFTGEDLTSALTSGDFDLVVITGDIYARLQNAIVEAETAFDKNIRVYVTTAFSDTAATCFATTDKFGKPVIDGASLKSPANTSIMLAVILNAVYGDVDALYTSADDIQFYIDNWTVLSPEMYAKCAKIGTDESTRIFSVDEFKQMIKYYNPDVTGEWLLNYIGEMCQIDGIIARRGIQ